MARRLRGKECFGGHDDGGTLVEHSRVSPFSSIETPARALKPLQRLEEGRVSNYFYLIFIAIYVSNNFLTSFLIA